MEKYWKKYDKEMEEATLLKEVEKINESIDWFDSKGYWNHQMPSPEKYVDEYGDYYVCFDSEDKPRIVIRTGYTSETKDAQGISAVWGIGGNKSEYELETEMLGAFEQKLNELDVVNKDYWSKVLNNMKLLNEIDSKLEEGKEHSTDELSEDEIKFLYNLGDEDHIETFGQVKNNEMNSYIQGIKKKITILTEKVNTVFSEEKTADEINFRYIKKTEGNIKFPQVIKGNFNMGELAELKNIELPNMIKGNFDMNSITKKDGSKLPELVGGNVSLDSLESINSNELPREIGKSLYLGIKDNNELDLSNIRIQKDIYLTNLMDLTNVKLPMDESNRHILFINQLGYESIRASLGNNSKYGSYNIKNVDYTPSYNYSHSVEELERYGHIINSDEDYSSANTHEEMWEDVRSAGGK